MNITPDSYNRIDKLNQLLDGKLTAEEQNSTEASIASSAEWRSELEVLRRDKAIIKEAVKEKLRQQANENLKSKSSKLYRMQIIRIAATVLVLLMAGFWFFDKNDSPTELYTAYYEMPQPSFSRNNAPSEDIFIQAMQDYNNHDIDKMITKLMSIDLNTTDIEPSRVNFFIGIGHMENNQFTEALNFLEKIPSQTALFPDAQWYSTLSLLKMKEIEKCKTNLKGFISSNHYKQEAAESLLKALN